MIKIKDNKLFFSKKNILTLARKYPTPFFLFSEKTLKDNYLEFSKVFSKNYRKIRLDFSVKTNNEQEILRILQKVGASCEVVAGFEIELCRKAGFSPKTITFDGPFKTDDEVSYALKQGIHAFYLDSIGEINRINKIAGKLGKKAKVGLRVNLGLKSYLSGIAETYIGKFGIPYKEFPKALKFFKKSANLEVIALSTHLGSQILSYEPYLKACEMMIGLAQKAKMRSIDISEINLGGGFPSQTLVKTTIPNLLLSRLGIKYEKKPPKLSEYGDNISKKFRDTLKKHKLKDITLAFQPGRSISSSMGIVVAKAAIVKDKWVFLDISTSSLPESIFFAQRKLIIANKLNVPHNRKYNIAGKGLNSADNFALNLSLPKLNEGDIVVILDAGAYSISRANRFTTLNPPVLLIKKNGQIKEIRRKEAAKDVLGPMEF